MNESDWKRYCELRPVAHERMCIRIMTDVEKIVLDRSIAPYERIETSEELLKAGQKELYWAFGVFRFSRHEARSHLLGLCARELITAQELSELFEANGLTGVRVLAGPIELPRLYGCVAGVGPSLVLDYRLLGEAVRDGFTSMRIGLEVGRDRLGKVQLGHGGLLFAVRPQCTLRND